MTQEFKPVPNIVPLFAVDGANNIQRFLGSGSFVEEPTLLLTADHVLGDSTHRFAMVTMLDLARLYPATVVYRDKDRDVALLRVDGYEAPQPLELATDFPPPNHHVVAFEYGTTRTIGGRTNLNPATRFGNVTRTVDVSFQYGTAGKDALELSFPALRGASGSPVMTGYSFQLVGMLIANVSYHLLPVQIERITDHQDKVVEETNFMLPQGIAVNFRHIRQAIDTYRALAAR